MQQEDPRQIYDQALQAAVQDRYDDALNYFNIVQQQFPAFPYIQQNINQCQLLGRAFKQYLRAIELMNQGNWNQALLHLDFTERSLQPDFKDCRQLIQECRQRYWFDQLQNQVSSLPEERQQLNDQIPILNNIYEEFQKAHFNKVQSTPQMNNNYSNMQRADIENEADIDNYAYSVQNTQLVAIYYQCTKAKNRCVIQRPSPEPFKHSQCRTTAYFNSTGIISCDSNCEKYSIYDALFSCQRQEVTSRNNEATSDLESITTQAIMADFVEKCLSKSGLPQALQTDFKVKLTLLLFPEMTRRGFI